MRIKSYNISMLTEDEKKLTAQAEQNLQEAEALVRIAHGKNSLRNIALVRPKTPVTEVMSDGDVKLAHRLGAETLGDLLTIASQSKASDAWNS